MNDVYLICPYWFYPQNLGDAVSWTSIPRAIKRQYPNCKLTVFTSHSLLEVLEDNPSVDVVSLPPKELVGNYHEWKDHALTSSKNLPENMLCVFAEHHPEVWSFWNKHYDHLKDHPTMNLLYLNHLLQIGMEDQVFEYTDFYPEIYIRRAQKEEKTLGIVPALKLAPTRIPVPHPGCDGNGYRFNGDDGKSWELFVKRVKELDKDIHILEFSHEHRFGDEQVPHLPWKDLAYQASRPTVTVLSDGGMHHIFNSQESKIVLLAAQRINKLDHYQSRNTVCYTDLHQKCLDRCSSHMRTLSSWKDMESICDFSCEKVDPIKLAEKVYEDFYNGSC